MASVLEEKDAIRELIARYCFSIDLGHFDEWIGLFTDDGTFDLGTFGKFSGKEALRGFLKSMPTAAGKPDLRHCVMNTIIDVQGTTATSQSYALVVQGAPQIGISVVARYADEIVKVGGAWKFKLRRVAFDMMERRRQN